MRTKICATCKNERRIKQYSLKKNGDREDSCRFCNYDGLAADEKTEILKEAYRHYPEFEAYVSATGKDIISYHVPKYEGSDEYERIDLSFTDLQEALKNVKLAPRKKEAFELNVLQDMLQREAADIMGITTVSVGQYVNQAVYQLANWYFADERKQESSKLSISDEEISDEN